MKSDSTWSVNDCRRLPGLRRNLITSRVVLVVNRQMLKKKNMSPMMSSHRARKGTGRDLY